MSCNAEAYVLPVSLSRGALIAILACIFVLLGKAFSSSWEGQTFRFWEGGCWSTKDVGPKHTHTSVNMCICRHMHA